MEKLYSCRKCALFCLLVFFVVLSTEAGTEGRYRGPHQVSVGESFALECAASPFDFIKWTRDGRAVDGGSSEVRDGAVMGVLRVSRAGPEHTGLYRCSSLLGAGHRVTVLGVKKVELNYDQKPYKFFDLRQTLVLQVNYTLDEGEKTVTVSWLKEGKPLDTKADEGRIALSDEDRTLTVSRAGEADAGNYTVRVSTKEKPGTEEPANVTVVLLPFVKLSPHTSVVEGEKLTVPCLVYGIPEPKVYWRIENTTYTESAGRVKLVTGEEKKQLLLISDSNMDDRGTYVCGARVDLGAGVVREANETETFVRVKDKMAALWPFLGICAEVVILCTIILIYEKKRNKTEMDESDTDGSPEQKNTPDHGKDSEVRHRK